MADNLEPPEQESRPRDTGLDPDQREYLDLLYRVFTRDLRSYVRKRMGDLEGLEDVVQNIWQRVARSAWFRGRGQPYSSGDHWVDPTSPNHRPAIWGTIARHARYALTSYFERVQIDFAGEVVDVEHVPFETWQQQGGDKAVDSNADEEQMVDEGVQLLRAHGFASKEVAIFVAYVWKGRTFREIAGDFGISKSKAHRIMHKIEAYFQDLQDETDD